MRLCSVSGSNSDVRSPPAVTCAVSKPETPVTGRRIAVLGDGGVMEYGTRDELLARGGMFKRLSELQSVQTEASAR